MGACCKACEQNQPCSGGACAVRSSSGLPGRGRWLRPAGAVDDGTGDGDVQNLDNGTPIDPRTIRAPSWAGPNPSLSNVRRVQGLDVTVLQQQQAAAQAASQNAPGGVAKTIADRWNGLPGWGKGLAIGVVALGVGAGAYKLASR